MNIEHVLYSHFCTANRAIFYNIQTFYLPEYFYPKIPKMCDPILVTLLKMPPHYSHCSRENATPSSGSPGEQTTQYISYQLIWSGSRSEFLFGIQQQFCITAECTYTFVKKILLHVDVFTCTIWAYSTN